MTFTFFGRRRLVTASAGDRLGKLRKVLSTAGIPFAAEAPEQSLSQVAPRPMRLTLSPVQDQRLEFPVAATKRIAVLTDGFLLSKEMRRIKAGDAPALRDYAPQGLVAPLRELRAMVLWNELPELDDAVVALSSIRGAALLQPRDRNALWYAFGTPVFEHLQSWDGTTIARECEVHDGLHIVEENAVIHNSGGELVVTQLNRFDNPVVRAQTGLRAEIVSEHCACGAESPRLRAVAAMEERSAAAAA